MKRLLFVFFTTLLCLCTQTGASADEVNLAKDVKAEVVFYNKTDEALTADMSEINSLTIRQ